MAEFWQADGEKKDFSTYGRHTVIAQLSENLNFTKMRWKCFVYFLTSARLFCKDHVGKEPVSNAVVKAVSLLKDVLNLAS